MKKFFSSESVTEGHPDKIADKIADSILDAALKEDPNSRVACEVSVTTDFCFIYGEISSKANLDYKKIARKAIKEIGYDDKALGYDYKTVEFLIKIDEQSPDIALGLNKEEQGAGDQGIMFGYAIDESKSLMPYAIEFANLLAERLAIARKNGLIPYLGPDGKTQVTVEYDEKNNVKRVDTIVLSTQHSKDVDIETVRKDVKEKVIDLTIPKNLVDKNTKYLINPTGRFVVGGPQGDAGLTGRKLIVDSYGGYARHGGGAMSGKDPSKVDRSAAYMARYLAKNIVASGIAKECEIQLGYAIGVAKPVSISVNTFNTLKYGVTEEEIRAAIIENFDLSPKGIIEKLDLKKPIYTKTSSYGHFGRDFSWEKLDSTNIFEGLKEY